MNDIKEPTTQLRPWPHVSSDWGHASLDLGISTAPPQVEESLPERYGIPLFEALIVDPEYLFLSWEVTDDQLRHAREKFGNKGFQARRLVAVMQNGYGAALAEYELYGEQGRWFIRHNHFGEPIRLKLRFVALGQMLELNETGLLQLPRVMPVEPEFYQEIEVIYGIGPKGQLILKGFMEDMTAPWPSISLKPPVFEHTLLPGEPVSSGPAGLPGSPVSGWLPSSPSGWPSSPKSGKHFNAGDPLIPSGSESGIAGGGQS